MGIRRQGNGWIMDEPGLESAFKNVVKIEGKVRAWRDPRNDWSVIEVLCPMCGQRLYQTVTDKALVRHGSTFEAAELTWRNPLNDIAMEMRDWLHNHFCKQPDLATISDERLHEEFCRYEKQLEHVNKGLDAISAELKIRTDRIGMK